MCGTPRRLVVSALIGLTMTLLAAGCSAPVRPDLPTQSPSPVAVAIPADGISLAAIGFDNGPRDAFSLPRSVVIATAVDQPDGVTVVMSSPAATAVAGYLALALPKAGFDVTHDDQTTATLTFTGYGWHGSFTGVGDSSAVTLRP